MTYTTKGYLKALKKVITELNPYIVCMTYREEKDFYEACRAYTTFCKPLIYSDIERLQNMHEILERINERK